MGLTAARRLHRRQVLLAASFFVGVALLFASCVAQTPQTMIAASRAALLVGLLGLRFAALGATADAGDDPTEAQDDGG